MPSSHSILLFRSKLAKPSGYASKSIAEVTPLSLVVLHSIESCATPVKPLSKELVLEKKRKLKDMAVTLLFVRF